MKTSDFDYALPERLIAQTPIEPRDHSRLMVLSRRDRTMHHRRFHELPEFLRAGDVMVFNDSRVFPARLHGTRVDGGGRVEVLLLRRVEPGIWEALVRPGRRMRPGTVFEVSDGVRGQVVGVETDGTRRVQIVGEEHLNEVGTVPLPPYVHTALDDAERYQTVYSRGEGSVAAPTAGLHFTKGLLKRIRDMGVELVFVTLHVGWDSFRPVRTEDITSHMMHSERWELGPGAAQAINRAKAEGRRVVSVGTTSVRLLEQAALTRAERDGPDDEVVAPGSGWADLFIYPGFHFQVVDALVTNFHLPKSTLLMLTSAFADREPVLRAYRQAAELEYRFYSFGDAMLIL